MIAVKILVIIHKLPNIKNRILLGNKIINNLNRGGVNLSMFNTTLGFHA